MSRVKKTPHQFLRNVVTGSLVAVVVVAIGGGIMKNVLVFMLTGIVEGTSIVVPVGGMFALYAIILAFIVGDRIVAYLVTPAETKPKARRQAPARRRYSH